MSDKSGFRPIYTVGEETDEMVEASYKAINTAMQKQPLYKEPTAFGITASQAKSIYKGMMVSFADELTNAWS